MAVSVVPTGDEAREGRLQVRHLPKAAPTQTSLLEDGEENLHIPQHVFRTSQAAVIEFRSPLDNRVNQNQDLGVRRRSRDAMEPLRVDAGPLVRAICDQLDVVSVLNEALPWDRRRCKLSPGERIQALIISCFLRPRPLYRVGLSFLTTDCEVLLGRGVVPDDFSDDCLGRALDKLAAAKPAKVFAAMSARAAVAEAVDRRFLHWDSTTRSFYGAYAQAAGSGPAVTYGHSKAVSSYCTSCVA
jgi:hypothetical protein